MCFSIAALNGLHTIRFYIPWLRILLTDLHLASLVSNLTGKNHYNHRFSYLQLVNHIHLNPPKHT